MTVYKQRYFHVLENWKTEEISFKIYFISVEKQNVDLKLVVKVKKYLKQSMPDKLAQNQHHKAGYIIIHQGDMGIWLLTHWWAYDNIVLSTLSNAKFNDSEFIDFDDQPFHACVWEHLIINHERNAWVEHVMTKNTSLSNYLKDRLINGYY